MGEIVAKGDAMTTIWKFPISIIDRPRVRMPGGAEIIHVGLDPEGVPCLWALVDSDEKPIIYDFWLCGTGNRIPDNLYANRHVGSFVEGPFVWHVFQ